MAQVINTNVLSLNAQRNLMTSQSSLATALQRLSSGLRINSAKDDAAGLAITDRFTTQIRGLNQAARNASDGISLAQVSESALAELTNNLQRIRELAVQAANSTNSASDRAALDLEVQQRLEEIDRIATQTSFNGQRVLDGTFGGATFQVGANVGETISLNLGANASMRRTAIGAIATATTQDLRGMITEATPGAAATAGSASFDATDLLADFSSETASFVVSLSGNDTTVTLSADYSGAGGIDDLVADIGTALGANFQVANTGNTITITSAATGAGTQVTIGGFDADADNNGTDAAVTAFPTVTSMDGTDAVPAQAAQSLTITELTITIGDADPISVAAGTYTSVQAFVDAVNTALAGNASASYDSETGVLSIVSGQTVTIGGADAANVFSATTFNAAGSIDTVNVLNLAGANDAIMRVDAALTSVSALRSTFGAIQNRFESTIANLHAVSENLEASRSRILDADFAAETAALTKAQILQQAGIAILAQANAQPQSVLALLQ
jgi:flagellin